MTTEMEKNWKAFNEMHAKVEVEHYGSIALFHDWELVAS